MAVLVTRWKRDGPDERHQVGDDGVARGRFLDRGGQ